LQPAHARSQADATRASLPSLLPILAVLAAIAALGFLSGGYVYSRTTPVALTLAGLAVAGVWLARGPVRVPRAYLVSLAAMGVFVLWIGLSILWSTAPDLSWRAFNVAALYLLVMLVCGILPGGKVQLRLAAYGFASVVVVVAVYALLGKIVPDVVTHAHVFARLRAPIGYWNALAAMIAMAIPIGLEAASRRDLPPWARGLVSSGLALLFFTLFFTFSRGAIAALIVALLVYFLVCGPRLSGFISLVIPVSLVAVAISQVRHLGTLFAETADDALRASQGHAFGGWVVGALALAFAGQALAALVQGRWPLPARAARLTGAAVLVILVSASIVFGVYYFPRHGGLTGWAKTRYDSALSTSGVGNDASRLVALNSSGRLPWYGEALRGWAAHRVVGTGAATFSFTHYLYRERATVVMHSHSQWLNVLSELGLVGFVLFAVAVGGLVTATFARLPGGRGDSQRSLMAACQAATVFFIVHMSLDWDWDMAAITVSFLLLAGTATAYARTQRRAAADPVGLRAPEAAMPTRARSLDVRLLATGLIAFGVVSWTLPYLSERATLAGLEHMGEGDFAAAAAAGQRASRLDPLAVDSLILLADAQAAQGRPAAARQTLAEAVRLQPRNYQPYYRMGVLESRDFGDEVAGEIWFRRALALNPLDGPTRRSLDQP